MSSDVYYGVVILAIVIPVASVIIWAMSRGDGYDVCKCANCDRNGVRDGQHMPKAWVKVVYQDVWLLGESNELDFCCVECLHEYCDNTRKTTELQEELHGQDVT